MLNWFFSKRDREIIFISESSQKIPANPPPFNNPLTTPSARKASKSHFLTSK